MVLSDKKRNNTGSNELILAKFNKILEEYSLLKLFKSDFKDYKNKLDNLEEIVKTRYIDPDLINKNSILDDIKEIKKYYEDCLEIKNDQAIIENATILNKIKEEILNEVKLIKDELTNDFSQQILEISKEKDQLVEEIAYLKGLTDVQSNKYDLLLESKVNSYAQITVNPSLNKINYNNSVLKNLNFGQLQPIYDETNTTDFEIIEEKGIKSIKFYYTGKACVSGLINLTNLSQRGSNYDETQLGLHINSLVFVGFIRKEGINFKKSDILILPHEFEVQKDQVITPKLGRTGGKSTLEVGIDLGSYLNFKRIL